jgi:hypothetical protein
VDRRVGLPGQPGRVLGVYGGDAKGAECHAETPWAKTHHVIRLSPMRGVDLDLDRNKRGPCPDIEL